jgi:hypothetical protein
LNFEENFAMKTFPFEGGEILMMPVPAPLQDTHKQQTQSTNQNLENTTDAKWKDTKAIKKAQQHLIFCEIKSYSSHSNFISP